MPKCVAVFDTNILVSAFIGRGHPFKSLLAVYDGKVELVISPEMLLELERVLSRPKFKYSPELVRRMVSLILRVARVVHPKEPVDIIKQDPQDNRILEAAFAGNAGLIVTGDGHLLSLKSAKGVRIITAAQFLQRI